MGFGGISIWQLVIILVIILLLFGTKRLGNIGSDLGNAIKGFRSAMRTGEEEGDSARIEKKATGDAIDAEASREKKNSNG
ncbi:MAG: twin-arginine translocase TatA/TatE family subunit [Gammaproteobacteria bacterium]|nr:twin-arginine translocase TatA/TatE family subunit [Gammaproteobacteria bacterium]MBU1653884.1 twin-arginine translocase TatA/TatE family subunit [Gammaproteobacteria bacterium]MBU1962596.1 twin-arginine translocase TatA/TatE family subunit [Gammaproteobacteria bacterium]